MGPGATQDARRGAAEGVRPAWACEITRFVGRERELESLRQLTDRSPLVTVVGPPGIGKTRLACRYGAGELEQGRSVWVGDFRAAETRLDLVSTVGQMLSLGPVQLDVSALFERVERELASLGPCTIVLDNLERSVEAAADLLTEWLRAAPQIRFVVTSRRVLRLAGERVLELKGLSVPDSHAASEAAAGEALELFLDRASAMEPSLSDSPDVRELVRRLEGVPLALELAAAQMRRGSPSEFLEQFPHALDLSDDRRSVDSRHRSLKVAIDSSWALLTAPERSVLEQVSVFRGGFDAEAASAVVRHARGWTNRGSASLSVLVALREASLLQLAGSADAGRRRWELLLSIRDYARDRFVRQSTVARDAVSSRHALHYAGLCRTLQQRIDAPDAASARRQLLRESENIDAALRWLVGQPHRTNAPDENAFPVVDLALGYHRGVERASPTRALPALTRAVEWFDRVHRDFGQALDSGYVRLRVARASAHRAAGDYDAAQADLDLPGDLMRRLPDDTAWVEWSLECARVDFDRGLVANARRRLEEALETSVVDSPALVGRVLTLYGWILAESFVDEAGLERLDEAVEMLRGCDPADQALARFFSVTLQTNFGRLDRPDALFECLDEARQLGDRWLEANTQLGLAYFFQDRGECERALEAYAEAKDVAERAVLRHTQMAAMMMSATCHEERGDVTRATKEYRDTLAFASNAGADRVSALCRCYMSASLIRAGRAAAASRCLAGALPALGRSGNRVWRSVADVTRIALARANGSQEVPTLGGDAEPEPFMSRSIVGRVALRLHRVNGPAAPLLQVWQDGTAFRRGEAPAVDLRDGPVSRRLLTALVEHRVRAPGEGVSAEEMLRLGWPGERVVQRARGTRVRNAVLRLRKLGLGDALQRAKGGYRLDPDLRVETVPSRFVG